MIVANTIPLPPSVNREARKVRQISVGKLLAQAVKCLHTGDSILSLDVVTSCDQAIKCIHTGDSAQRLFDMDEGVNLLA